VGGDGADLRDDGLILEGGPHFQSLIRARTLLVDRYDMVTYLGQYWAQLYDLSANPFETYKLCDDLGAQAWKHSLVWQLMQSMMNTGSLSQTP